MSHPPPFAVSVPDPAQTEVFSGTQSPVAIAKMVQYLATGDWVPEKASV